MELPDEIWNIIKDYQINYKKHHIKKYKPIISIFKDMFKTQYERWVPLPIKYSIDNYDLPLTTISFNCPGNGRKGWWCGYGWMLNKYRLKLK